MRWWPESLHVPVTAQVRVPGGGTLFQAQAEVRLPNDADPTELRGALERIAAELMVDLGLVDGDR